MIKVLLYSLSGVTNHGSASAFTVKQMNEMVYDEVWTETAAQIAYYKIRGIDYRQKFVDGSVGRIPAPPKGSALYPAYAKGTKEISVLARKVVDTIADGFEKIKSFVSTIR